MTAGILILAGAAGLQGQDKSTGTRDGVIGPNDALNIFVPSAEELTKTWRVNSSGQLNLPLIGMWIKLLQVPYRVLYPAILLFCAIGVYTISNASFDVGQTAFFGFLGILFVKLECEPAPLLLGFVLGPMMEENLRRALLLSRGDPTVFFTRPLSLVMLLMAVALILLIALPNIRKTREVAFQEE